jgi:transposase-like protein
MKGRLEMGNNNKYKYDEEFKANAVRLVVGGRAVAEVARDLGVSEPALR